MALLNGQWIRERVTFPNTQFFNGKISRDTPPDANPVGTARASLPHDRTLLFHRSFLDTQMLPFTYPRPDTSTVSTTDYPSAAMYRVFIQKYFSTRF